MAGARVRYITIPRMAVEIVCTQGTEAEAIYLEAIHDYFCALESGEEMPEMPEPQNRIVGIALKESAEEIRKGYKNYLQKIGARKKENQRSTADEPPIDQRSTAERNRTDITEQTELNRPDNNRPDLTEIYSSLIPEGWSREKIDAAVGQVDNWHTVKHPVAFVRSILDGRVKPRKRKVSAQEYDQRPYGDEHERPEEQIRRLQMELEGTP